MRPSHTIVLCSVLVGCARTLPPAPPLDPPAPSSTVSATGLLGDRDTVEGSSSPETASATDSVTITSTPEHPHVRITIGSSTFTATLDDNATARAFSALLPVTLVMAELNANEKYADLPRSLPGHASNPGVIHAGDLMLYGSRTVVLFYETFPTSYRYTRIGRMDDPSALAAALGSADATVTFSL